MKKELQSKVEHAISVIKKGERLALAMNPEKGYWLGFSGGKDSLAVLGLARLANVKYDGVYCVTGNDSPDSVRYIRENFSDVRFLHPKHKFIQLVAMKGLPTIGRQFCCERLKERQSYGQCVLLGIRAQESPKRAKYDPISIASRRVEHQGKPSGRSEEWLDQVEHKCIKGRDQVRVYPIFDWSEQDVYEFIADQHLPLNPMYEKFGRVGCMFCPFASRAQVEEYERMFPRYRAAILRAVEKNLEHRGEHPFRDPEDYYEWWKSKKSIQAYLKSRP